MLGTVRASENCEPTKEGYVTGAGVGTPGLRSRGARTGQSASVGMPQLGTPDGRPLVNRVYGIDGCLST